MSRISLPQRLASALLTELASGNYHAGMRFLSRRKIMRMWDVSDMTATRALIILEGWQLLCRTDRSGHYLQEGFRERVMLLLQSAQDIALTSQPDWLGKARTRLHQEKPLRRIAVIVQITPVIASPQAPAAAIFESLSSQVLNHSLQAVFRTAKAHGTSVDFYIDDTSTQSQSRILGCIHQSAAQGVVVVKYLQHSDINTIAKPLLNNGIPVVVAFNDCSNANVSAINFNNINMGHTALKILAQAGHRHIAVALPPRIETPFYFQDRLIGCQVAARASALPIKIYPLIGEVPPLKGNPRLKALFNKKSDLRISAIFFTSMHLLPKYLPALKERKFKLPQDLSLIACSATEKTPSLNFPIDILKMDFDKMGTQMFLTLLSLFKGSPTEKIHLVNCHYEAHGSVLRDWPRLSLGRIDKA